MNVSERIIMIAIAAFATMLTRFLPFFVFSEKHGTPKFIDELGKFLPPSILGMLVIYCYKDALLNVNLTSLLTVIAGIFVVVIHVWKRNMLLSIFSGTALYILLINSI